MNSLAHGSRLGGRSLSTLALAAALACVLAAEAEEPSSPPLTEKEIKTLLRENDQRLAQARRARQRGESETLEQQVREYTESADRLSQAVETDHFDAADPEALLWRVDAAALKQRKLLERIGAAAPDELEVVITEATRAASRESRAALDALTRLRKGELRLGGRGRSGIHAERQEEVWIPTPGGPVKRPRPNPQPFH